MTDLKKADKGLDTVDSILTKIGKIFKKHWWVMLILLVVWFFYWALTSEDEGYPEDPYYDEYYDEGYDEDGQILPE